MKVLIWLVCCFIHYILSSIIKPIVFQIPRTDDRSVLLVSSLYGILIAFSFGLCFWFAKFLCKKWDLYKVSKNTSHKTRGAYSELLEKEKVDEVKAEKLKPEVAQTAPTPVENVVCYSYKPTKKVRSKKPLIIVTYILLIAVIIALAAFCVLSIQNKDNMISQLEADKVVLQDELESTESKLKVKENELKTIKVNLKNTQNSLTDTNTKLSNTISSLTDARTDAAYWKEKYMATDPANVTYSYVFSSVNELYLAIKSNPTAYNNKQVKVYGMLFTYKTSNKSIGLIDYKGEEFPSSSSLLAGVFLDEKIEAKTGIKVTLSNDLEYTVAETGDYVNLYGTVKISNGEIYLDKCQYN